MENSIHNLSLRFRTKGFIPIEIPGLIKDVFSIFGTGRHFTLREVNQELEELGWGLDIMDLSVLIVSGSSSWS